MYDTFCIDFPPSKNRENRVTGLGGPDGAHAGRGAYAGPHAAVRDAHEPPRGPDVLADEQVDRDVPPHERREPEVELPGRRGDDLLVRVPRVQEPLSLRGHRRWGRELHDPERRDGALLAHQPVAGRGERLRLQLLLTEWR